VIDAPISHAELASLVASNLTVEAGRALAPTFPYAPGAPVRVAEIYFSRPNELQASWGARFKRIRTAIFLERWKYIRSSDGKDELYDLEHDPAEARNLIGERPALAEKLRAKLETFISEAKRADSGATPVQMSAKELEELEKLGYY
jgi:hypothetical protein